jgi:hypothetical protein
LASGLMISNIASPFAFRVIVGSTTIHDGHANKAISPNKRCAYSQRSDIVSNPST